MEFAYIKKKKTFFQWKNIFPFFTLSFNPSLPLSSPISPLILDLWGHDHLPCCKFLTNVCVTYLLLSSFICLSTVPDVSTYQHVPFSDFEVSLAVDYHSATEVHHATDFTFDLERTTTSVSQPRIFLCTDLQRNRASAPTAQTFSLIEPTKSVPLLTVRTWSLRCVSEARHFSVKSSTPNSASCTCISLTFNFPCCVLSVRIVSGMCRYQLWKPGIHSGSFA